MTRLFVLFFLLFFANHIILAQPLGYKDALLTYQKKYVQTHEVVKGDDKTFFRFFKINQKYKVIARFEKISDSSGFIMKTSGKKTPRYYRYGKLYFSIDKKALQLTVYQSEQLMADSSYRDYLFVPYTDITSGEKSYGGGKYIDIRMNEIRNNRVIIDFNKAYNPYCAYTTGYNCPIPPAENDLSIAIEAGEMEFAKPHDAK
jgi:uncharacterized protein